MKVYTVDLWTDKPPDMPVSKRVTGEYFRTLVMVADGSDRKALVDAAMKGVGVKTAEVRSVQEVFLPCTTILGRWYTED